LINVKSSSVTVPLVVDAPTSQVPLVTAMPVRDSLVKDEPPANEIGRLEARAHVMYIHHMARLVRKQVYLTVEQDELLKQAAAHERKTEAEVIRSALDQRLRPKRAPRRPSSADPLWGIVGLGRSGVPDVSEQVDHYLYGSPKR
jgi:hypothetical protein